jgi:hypothetical protein
MSLSGGRFSMLISIMVPVLYIHHVSRLSEVQHHALGDSHATPCWLQIFGIYMLKEGSAGTLEDVLQPGSTMVAAGYCMYGSSCTVSFSIHRKV